MLGPRGHGPSVGLRARVGGPFLSWARGSEEILLGLQTKLVALGTVLAPSLHSWASHFPSLNLTVLAWKMGT